MIRAIIYQAFLMLLMFGNMLAAKHQEATICMVGVLVIGSLVALRRTNE